MSTDRAATSDTVECPDLGWGFAAVDVETANSNPASICQIGVVSFANGAVVDVWQTLIDPGDRFDPINVSIHGVDQASVCCAPRFPDVAPKISALLSGKTVASHMAFDKVALERTCEKYSLPRINCTWLDTARVSRRAWPQFARRGYGLAAIASWCGIRFDHHRAQEDAWAAGSILLCAVAATGLSVSDWVDRSREPIRPGTRWRRTKDPLVSGSRPAVDHAGLLSGSAPILGLGGSSDTNQIADRVHQW